MHATHPLRVAPGEVIVHRHHVDAFSGERVKIRGEGGGERLSLTRRHLADAPLVQQRAAHDLHVEVSHVEFAPRRLADHGERLDSEIVEGVSLLETRAELVRLGAELLGGVLAVQRVERVDGDDDVANLLVDDAGGARGDARADVGDELLDCG